MKSSIIKDEALESELLEKGFVTMPLLTQEEVAEVQKFYDDTHFHEMPGTFSGIHMTTWSDNAYHKRIVKDFIKKVFEKALQAHFKDYKQYNHVFIAKQPGDHTEFNVHQDWSIVDESKYYSVNVWVPLADTDESNGALWIIPGSHHWGNPIRGAGVLFPDYRQQDKLLKERSISVPLKAGEALVFFHSTIHGSPPNRSDKDRVVATCAVIPEEASLRIAFQAGSDAPLEIYQPDEDFVFQYDNIRSESITKPPMGKLIETRQSLKLDKITL